MKKDKGLSINIRGSLRDFSRPWVMGILNVTDDSFYSGCRVADDDALRGRIRTIHDEGADCIDIGACSTRPGSLPVSAELETERLLKAIAVTREEWNDAVISVDTFRSGVARECVKASADIVNDISGGTLDADMFDTVASLKVPYVLTHLRGTPATMQTLTDYENVVADVITQLAFRAKALRERGVCDIIVDPGFGFAKTPEQNYQLLAGLPDICGMDLPVLVGVSRKSMIWKPLGISPAEALPGTIALNTYALRHGADIIRVHDVAAAVQTRDVAMKISNFDL